MNETAENETAEQACAPVGAPQKPGHLWTGVVTKALSSFQILPYTDEAEQLYQSWPAKQKRVGPNDCRIAASAIVAGLTVVTCNQKDFSTVPGLVWEDWSKP